MLGIVVNFLRARRLFPNAFVATLGWHLGDEPQNISMLNGYDQSCEDDLLESFDWRKMVINFLHSSLALSSSRGWFPNINESIVCTFQGKCSWPSAALMKASSPGGGLVNLDFFKLVVAFWPVLVLGEVVFISFMVVWLRMFLSKSILGICFMPNTGGFV